MEKSKFLELICELNDRKVFFNKNDAWVIHKEIQIIGPVFERKDGGVSVWTEYEGKRYLTELLPYFKYSRLSADHFVLVCMDVLPITHCSTKDCVQEDGAELVHHLQHGPDGFIQLFNNWASEYSDDGFPTPEESLKWLLEYRM